MKYLSPKQIVETIFVIFCGVIAVWAIFSGQLLLGVAFVGMEYLLSLDIKMTTIIRMVECIHNQTVPTHAAAECGS